MSFITSYIFAEELFFFLTKPLVDRSTDLTFQFIFTQLSEAFSTYLNVTLFYCFVLNFPLFIYHLWAYLKPGLHLFEEKILRSIVLSSLLLFLGGGLFGYSFFFPILWDFFLSFEVGSELLPFQVRLEARMLEYFNLFSSSFLVIIFSFQTPLLLGLGLNLGLYSVNQCLKSRNFFILGLFLMAAFISPPDIFSQILIALPLVLFFEGVVFFFIYQKNRLI